MKLWIVLIALALWAGDAGDGTVLANLKDGKWEPEAKTPGAESLTLRGDGSTGLELIARYPGGHRLTPHWHSANERIIVQEGRLAVKAGASQSTLEAGAYAFFPAKQVHEMTCVSKERCAFYIAWDGKLDFHR